MLTVAADPTNIWGLFEIQTISNWITYHFCWVIYKRLHTLELERKLITQNRNVFVVFPLCLFQFMCQITSRGKLCQGLSFSDAILFFVYMANMQYDSFSYNYLRNSFFPALLSNVCKTRMRGVCVCGGVGGGVGVMARNSTGNWSLNEGLFLSDVIIVLSRQLLLFLGDFNAQ